MTEYSDMTYEEFLKKGIEATTGEEVTEDVGWSGYHGRLNPWSISVWAGGAVIEVKAEPDRDGHPLIFGNGGSSEARKFAIALLQAAEVADELDRQRRVKPTRSLERLGPVRRRRRRDEAASECA